MNEIHDTLRSMPWWALAAIGVLLAAGVFGAEEPGDRKIRLAQGRRQDWIDNVASWLCFAALIVLGLAYYWMGAR